MKNIDRRQWLKSIGLAGTMAFINPANMLSSDKQHSFATSKSGLISLTSNENPYGPSQKVRKAITASFDNTCRYPFAYLKALVRNIAEKEGVPENCIVVTGGSTEGLKASGLTYGLGGREIIAADPTFQAMLKYAENFGAYVHRVPVNDKMEHDLEEMASRVTSKTGLIFLCNPNNPTGTLLDKDKLKDFCNSLESKAVIFSDEAYYDYITDPDYPSMVELVKEGKNVIVSKTFSKVYGLAGIRIGYLVARPDIATRLKSNVMAMTNVLAIAAANEAIKDDEFYKFSISKNYEGKSLIYRTLDKLKLSYIESHTNFVFFQSNKHIRDLSTEMMNAGVAIGRPFPPMYDWARISTGTIEEVNAFCQALEKVYS
ncbi:pyridoxal phosphate-dependent aminotransferase [Marivirga harenae]|uniref:pyridoxal phosphate-dependent aminotransferase n=1 Tax=Marivirga harenae TaxID=2010992 RepID=UPI0026DECAF0|nr:histidinol-phosphate transaminase [Marivirga harenae]WKV13158.1 histidinol-phosphate transaminase [Marivirga harenae]